MATYRVRPGFTHGSSNEFRPGDLVEMDEEAAYGFRDKLELVQEAVSGQQSAVGNDFIVPDGYTFNLGDAHRQAAPEEAMLEQAVEADVHLDPPETAVVEPEPEDGSTRESPDIRVDVLLNGESIFPDPAPERVGRRRAKPAA